MCKTIDRQVTHNFEKRTGISLTRYEMLHTLLNRGKLPQTELQQSLKIDQAAITRHLKILEDKSFVLRERNKQNNREVIVEITDEGRKVLEDCDGNRKQFFDDLFIDFSEEEKRQLQTLVTKLLDNSNKQFI